MTSTSENHSRRPGRPTWVLLVLLALGVAVGWWLSRAEPDAPPAVTQASTRASPSPTNPAAPATATAPAAPLAAAPTPQAPTPAPPIVDEVRVEKEEVCSGEENLVSVRAHTPDGNDAYLHYTVGDGTGQRIPVRVWRDDSGAYELPRVTVFTKDNVSVTVPVPAYRVKDCEPERLVHVMSRRLPNSEADYEFFARVVDKPTAPGQPAPKPFVPTRYVWTFDDSATETTSGPLVSHALAPGPGLGGQYTQHLVRVEVFDASGRKETGRSSLQVLNTSFENFDKKGIVTLFAAGTPRFPVLDADGVVRQTFRLSHHFRGTVRLTRVTAIRAFIGDKNAPPPPEQVEPATLSVSEIPEGPGTEVKLTFDTQAEPGVFSLTYALEGVSADGHPARGTFSLMRPPPRPTRDNSAPITNPVLLAKVKRARELLHQEFVTDEDLLRLEREGRFADLQASAPPPAKAQPPARNPGR
ncbi:hypothetical protein CYFUS_000721 [Cystobacter fuscus]|uniref:Uncharacterized protein n=1 Tax=Cystobacter fuscus TaxID=43 RepID=A0A250IU87_9BACT|nr:hypothetical protein [Cystobacter fuscus]ATB35309.1 hypothetical protein CYFUS_000721 [Cystobacter fuscus]